MLKHLVRFPASAVTAICIVVGLFCPWGYFNAVEPGQASYRVIFPVVFVAAIILGSVSAYVAKKCESSAAPEIEKEKSPDPPADSSPDR